MYQNAWHTLNITFSGCIEGFLWDQPRDNSVQKSTRWSWSLEACSGGNVQRATGFPGRWTWRKSPRVRPWFRCNSWLRWLPGEHLSWWPTGRRLFINDFGQCQGPRFLNVDVCIGICLIFIFCNIYYQCTLFNDC